MFLSLFKAGGVGALQADQSGQGRRVASFQAQGGIGGKMALSFFRIKIVVALDVKATEYPLSLQALPPLVMLSGLGWVSGVAPIRRLLKEKGDHLGGGFKNSHPHQQFPWLGGGPADGLAAQAADQLLEFGILGRGHRRREFAFFCARRRCRRGSGR